MFALTDGFISKPGSRGTYSEFVTFPASWAAPAPVSLPLAAAAAVPLVALTAWQALERANPSAGQRLLILGSSGGVGQVAVQLAKVHGLHVTALASHRRAEVVASLGADEVFEYDRDEGGGAAGLGDRFSAPGLQFDIVFDVLGGEYLDAAVARALKPGGVVTVVRNRGLAADKMETYAAAARDGSGPALYVTLVEPNGGQLARVGQLIDEGKLRVVVAHQWPVERVADAHRLVEDGHAGGKVVLTY